MGLRGVLSKQTRSATIHESSRGVSKNLGVQSPPATPTGSVGNSAIHYPHSTHNELVDSCLSVFSEVVHGSYVSRRSMAELAHHLGWLKPSSARSSHRTHVGG